MICAYCGREKHDLTGEHVLPKAIGGALEPVNPFKLDRVCERCNTVCGKYVDGPFIRSWFLQNLRARDALKFVDLSRHPVLPLSYTGILKDLSTDDEVCENWLGPAGDSIYHFHPPYPEVPELPPMIGPPIAAHSQDVKHEYVFIFVVATNPDWHPTIMKSFVEHFRGAVLFLGNGPCPSGGAFSEIPEELRDKHELLKSYVHKKHKITFPIGKHYGDRFAVKLALGMGALFLGDEFITSSEADELRSFLWGKTDKDRKNATVRGTPFLSETLKGLKRSLAWEGAHTVLIMPAKGRSLALSAFLYAEQSCLVQITEDRKHWEGRIPREGHVFIVVPGLRKCVGPVSVPAYIAHRLGYSSDEELSALARELERYKKIPPFHI